MSFLRACLLGSSLLIGFVANMHALTITPDSEELIKSDFSSNSQSVVNSEINAFLDPDPRLAYKQNVGGSEEGPFATSYSTSFNSPSNPSGATISFDSGYSIADGTYLLVKDGNHSPYAYLFDISGWDGTEIVLEGFWPGAGAISQVSIYRVPDGGTTLMLLGIALVGLAAVRKWNRLPTV